MTDNYQGDPYITIDEDGANLTFRGGQYLMDQGLENPINLSLFTRGAPGSFWFGNTFFKKNSQKLGSRFEESTEQPITVSSLNNTRNEALAALKWMRVDGIVSKIDVSVTNPESNRLRVVIFIQPPSGETVVLIATKHGASWITQIQDPAHLKVD
jgi:phage gp46-like protein